MSSRTSREAATIRAGSAGGCRGPGQAAGAALRDDAEERLLRRDGEGLGADLAVAEQAAGGGAGALSVLERDLAVDQRPAIALGALDDAPFAGRQIVQDLELPLGGALQLGEVVDDDVGRRAFT